MKYAVLTAVLLLISAALLFLFLATAAHAEDQISTHASASLNTSYFSGYWFDTKNIVTSPARWDSSDWIEATAVVGIAGALFTQDDKIKTWVQDRRTAGRTHLANDVSSIYTYSFPALGILGLYGFIASDSKAESTFLLGAESGLVTALFVQTLKRSTGRHRPYTGDSHNTWSGPVLSGHDERLSFPSGDVSTAFAFASVVASEYDNYIVPPLVYGAAGLVALERVYKNAHWSSDVFLGGAIGYFTGKSIVRYHTPGAESRLSVAPVLDENMQGVAATFRY